MIEALVKPIKQKGEELLCVLKKKSMDKEYRRVRI